MTARRIRVVSIISYPSCSRLLLERALTDKANNLDSHRFLVQTKMIETEDYEKIMSLAIPQRIEEVCKWLTEI